MMKPVDALFDMHPSEYGQHSVRMHMASDKPSIDANQEQFEVELEFVQCLANPSYLNCRWLGDASRETELTASPLVLAQNEYLDKREFIEYIEYLQYWRSPQYVRFIMFPHALYFLRLLREKSFRDAIKRGKSVSCRGTASDY